MQDFEEHFTNELLQLKEIKAITQDKDRDVKLQVCWGLHLNAVGLRAAFESLQVGLGGGGGGQSRALTALQRGGTQWVSIAGRSTAGSAALACA
jgi:hypothetical protein